LGRFYPILAVLKGFSTHFLRIFAFQPPATALTRFFPGAYTSMMKTPLKCAICGCKLHRTPNTYARPTPEGRSHASKHHYIPERFFGRSKTRRGTQRAKIFTASPWGHEGETALFCYDCHEELIHNPVLLPEDVEAFANIVKARGLSETRKSNSRTAIAGRIQLLHEIIHQGIVQIQKRDSTQY